MTNPFDGKSTTWVVSALWIALFSFNLLLSCIQLLADNPTPNRVGCTGMIIVTYISAFVLYRERT